MKYLVAFLGLFGLSVLVPAAAGAQDISSRADVTWDVTTPDPGVRHSATVRALVRDLVEYDGYMYAGGKFLEVKAPDGTTYDQPYLARFDLVTGVWDDTFRPEVDGMIYAIDITPDGRLYAAGELTGGIALYDASTGARNNQFDPAIVNSWGPPAVYDIEVVGNDVYAGGSFTGSQGTSLADLAKVDATTGALDPAWQPRTDFDTETPRSGGHIIYGLAVDASRDRVYLAGKFGGINGNMDAAYFATLDTTTGATRNDVPQGLPAGIPNHREGFSMWMHDVQYHEDRVYVGGQGHQTMILDVDTLLPYSTFFTNRGIGDPYGGGDTQVIFVGESTVWSGCHCWGSVGEYELFSYNSQPDGVQTYAEYLEWVRDFRLVNPFGQMPVRGGFGLDIQSETLLPLTFEIVGQSGAFAIAEDSNGRVWFGGQYTGDIGNDRSIEGMVRFSPVDDQPPVVGPTGLRTTLQTRERVVLNWQAVAGAASYQILRDGVVVGDSTSLWHTDRDLAAGTTYTYQVQAVLDDGTISLPSDSITATTEGDAVDPDAGPTGLRSTLQTRERIVITWDSYDGATSYQIVRDGTVIADSTSRWHTDLDLAAGTSYTYEVQAVLDDGTISAASDPITVSTMP